MVAYINRNNGKFVGGMLGDQLLDKDPVEERIGEDTYHLLALGVIGICKECYTDENGVHLILEIQP